MYGKYKIVISSILFALTVYFLYNGFVSNRWMVAGRSAFKYHLNYDESAVLGRILESRKSGIFSHGALLGWVGKEEAPPAVWKDLPFMYSYEAIENGLGHTYYQVYRSTPGVIGVLLSFADRAFPGSEKNCVNVFRSFMAMGLAFVLGLIVLWACIEIGVVASLMLLLSLIVSVQLTLIGANLYWHLWTFYLPLALMLWLLRYRRKTIYTAPALSGIAVLMVMGVTMFTNGAAEIILFYFVVTGPLVFYGLADLVKPATMIRCLFYAGAGCIVAASISLAVLVSQIACADGDLMAAWRHISSRVETRTYSHLEDEAIGDRMVHMLSVFPMYMKQNYYDPGIALATRGIAIGRDLGVRYYHVVGLFALATMIGLLLARSGINAADALQLRALSLTTWWTALSVIIFFIIFNELAHEHPHYAAIYFHKPFTIWGFLLVGKVAGVLLRIVTKSIRLRYRRELS